MFSLHKQGGNEKKISRPAINGRFGPTVLTLALTLGFLGSTTAVAAQDRLTTTPDEILQQLREIGFAPPSQVTGELYAPLLAQAPTDGVIVTNDVAYGEHERHALDLYQPEDASNAKIIVYVHGGGYTAGDKSGNSNVPTYFARNGYLGVAINYRLAPDHQWPAGGQDVAAAVEWLKDNAAEYGGNPDEIFVMGHSAGATHVATYAFDRRFQPADGHGLSGVILSSGRYQSYYDPDDPALSGIHAYWGDDASLYESRSIVPHVPNSSVPVMLVIAEFDQRNLVATTGELFVALCDRDDGRCPRLIQTRGHNHISAVRHFNTGDDLLGREIIDFVEDGAPMRAEWVMAQ